MSNTNSEAATGRDARTTVLFIGGYGRMGSTLLDRMLGQHPLVFSGGELRHFWDRALRDDQLCECGQQASVCEVWGSVIERGFGSVEDIRDQKPWQLWQNVDRIGMVPRVIRRQEPPSGKVRTYVAMLSQLIGAIVEETGARVVIDSSKYPVHGMILNLLPDIDLRVVHLIRDPRAVAFSWQRTKERPEIHWEKSYIRKRSVLESSAAWLASSVLIEANRRADVPQIDIRYEDWMRSPQPVMELLWRFAGLSPADDVIRDRVVRLKSGHTISGNPSRFQSGDVALRLDDEWVRALDPARKTLVSVITMPGLFHYGYPLIGRGP